MRTFCYVSETLRDLLQKKLQVPVLGGHYPNIEEDSFVLSITDFMLRRSCRFNGALGWSEFVLSYPFQIVLPVTGND